MTKNRGARPKPRVAVVGSWTEEEQSALKAMFRSVEYYASVGRLRAEWPSPLDHDLVVLTHWTPGQGTEGLEGYDVPHVIAVGPVPCAVPFGEHRLVATERARSSEHHTDDPPGRIGRRLNAWLDGVEHVRHWHIIAIKGMARRASQSQALVTGADSEDDDIHDVLDGATILWAHDPRGALGVVTHVHPAGFEGGEPGEWFGLNRRTAFLPNVKDHRVAWVEAIVHDWAEQDRETFATVIPWREQPEWQTAQERELAGKVAEIEARRAKLLAELKGEQDQVEEQLAEARRAADGFERAILTTKGTELVVAVSRMLNELGFEVRDMDAEKQPGEPKREDLRLTHPFRPGWVALVEVKGSATRSTGNDFARQINRAANRYRDEANKWPDLKLVIHNGEFSLPPGHRHRPFETAPAEREEHAADGLLVIGTEDLFRLYRDREQLGDAAAQRIISERGVFEHE